MSLQLSQDSVRYLSIGLCCGIGLFVLYKLNQQIQETKKSGKVILSPEQWKQRVCDWCYRNYTLIESRQDDLNVLVLIVGILILFLIFVVDHDS